MSRKYFEAILEVFTRMRDWLATIVLARTHELVQ